MKFHVVPFENSSRSVEVMPARPKSWYRLDPNTLTRGPARSYQPKPDAVKVLRNFVEEALVLIYLEETNLGEYGAGMGQG